MTEEKNNSTPAEGAQKKKGLIAHAAKPLDKMLAAIDTAPDEADSLTWEESAERAYVEQNPIKTRVMFYTLCTCIVVLIVWSAFAEVDQVTRGEGKVIPSQQVQILQSLDGGVITDIRTHEGDIVEKDQLLIKLDATRFQSTFEESNAERLALKAKIARLSAVVEDSKFNPDNDLTEVAPDLVAHEQKLFETSLQELAVLQEIGQQQITQREEELEEAEAARDRALKTYSLASRELEFTKPLVNSGAVSQVEILRLERDIANMVGERDQALAQIRRLRAAISEAKQKFLEVELNYKNDIREEMSTAMARLSALEEASSGLSDRVKQTSVRSPVRGTVKRLYFNTIGGVVLAGKEIVEIIPLDDSLLLEARIKPQDIAFLHPGQVANVKFTAYDFVVYGGLDAKVEHIGADTVMDENGNPFYIVRVRTLESSLGEGKPIIPGMVATVDILTGKKTILAYILKPLLRAKQYALTEE